jgi:hypothetical protein
MNLGIVHDFGGRHVESLAEFRRVVAMDPRFVRGHTFLSVQLMWLGDLEAAVDASRVAFDQAREYPMFAMTLAISLFRAGHREEAEEKKAIALGGGLPPVYVAFIHAMFGDHELALDSLERGYEERGDWMYTIAVQTVFRDLRTNPRFVALVEKVRRGGPPPA